MYEDKLIKLFHEGESFITDGSTICINDPKIAKLFFRPKKIKEFYDNFDNAETKNIMDDYEKRIHNSLSMGQYERIIGAMELKLESDFIRWLVITDKGSAFYCSESIYRFYINRKHFAFARICKLDEYTTAFVFTSVQNNIKVLSLMSVEYSGDILEDIQYKIKDSL